MPTITASTGSIDVNSIVTQLMQVERQPLQKLDQTRTGVQTKLSAVGKIQGALSSLQDAARTLSTITTWQAAKAESADNTIVGASAAGGAPVGNYSVLIDRMAARQSVSGPAVASGTSIVGGGTLTIQMGSSAAGFTADAARPATTVTIDADASLVDVVSAINSSNSGVTATIVKDGANSRLLLRSTDSGESNAFRISVTESGGNSPQAAGLTMAAFDPAAPTAGRTILNSSAQDAAFNFGGMPLTASSNKIDGIVQNTTIELRRTTTTPVDVSVTADNEAIRKAVDTFVKAYNELNTLVTENTKYDATSKTAGALQGFRSVLTVQGQMRDIISGSVATGTLRRLSDAGIEVQRDGSLSVVESKFNQAAANPRNLQTLFAQTDTVSPANSGLARRLIASITSILGTEGTISGATDTLRRRIGDIDAQKARLETRLVDIEKRLRTTYSNLDTRVSTLTSQGQRLLNGLGGS